MLVSLSGGQCHLDPFTKVFEGFRVVQKYILYLELYKNSELLSVMKQNCLCSPDSYFLGQVMEQFLCAQNRCKHFRCIGSFTPLPQWFSTNDNFAPRDIWHSLKIFWLLYLRQLKILLESRGWRPGCCQTSYNVQESSPQQRIFWFQILIMMRLIYPAFWGIRDS